MAYLGIDLARASGLVDVLLRSAAHVDPIVHDLHEAEQIAALTVGVDELLLEIESDYRASAAQVGVATDELQSLHIKLAQWLQPPPEPVRMPDPIDDLSDPTTGAGSTMRDPLWNAWPDMPWNRVRQEASHNSYEVPGGIAALYATGVRTFELDIHRGAPTRLLRPNSGSWLRRLTETFVDHFDHAGGLDDDWRVYHVTGSATSEYEYLSDGLQAIAALDATDPITLFIDNKDAFAGTHLPEQFDALVRAELGDRLFGPADLLARAPGATTLLEAIAAAGWPTVEELEGRVMVVLTDEIESYHHPDGIGAAFVAPPPQFDDRSGFHVPDPMAVFYNADATSVNEDSMAAIAATEVLLRTYFNPRCEHLLIGESAPIVNFRAVDIEPGEPACPSPSPAPPEGTPVPE